MNGSIPPSTNDQLLLPLNLSPADPNRAIAEAEFLSACLFDQRVTNRPSRLRNAGTGSRPKRVAKASKRVAKASQAGQAARGQRKLKAEPPANPPEPQELSSRKRIPTKMWPVSFLLNPLFWRICLIQVSHTAVTIMVLLVLLMDMSLHCCQHWAQQPGRGLLFTVPASCLFMFYSAYNLMLGHSSLLTAQSSQSWDHTVSSFCETCLG